jgi:hypothetical protein
MAIRPHKGTEAEKKKEAKPAKKVAKHAPKGKMRPEAEDDGPPTRSKAKTVPKVKQTKDK